MEGFIPLLRLVATILLVWCWVNRLIHRKQLKQAARATATAPEPITGASIPELATLITTPDAPPLNAVQVARLRPLLLHWLGLRTDLGTAQIAEQVPDILRRRWFTLDLQHLSADTAPHAALAFACLRVAFHLRAAYLLGWLDDSLYEQLTHLNACRVRECFKDWHTFTLTCDQGRTQWQSRGRTDLFGDHLNTGQIWPWLWVDTSGRA